MLRAAIARGLQQKKAQKEKEKIEKAKLEPLIAKKAGTETETPNPPDEEHKELKEPTRKRSKEMKNKMKNAFRAKLGIIGDEN